MVNRPIRRLAPRQRQLRDTALMEPEVREVPREASPTGDAPIRKRKFRGDSHIDKYNVPVPEGWSYEWKRATVAGQPDPSYDVFVRAQGWEPVDVSRHPDLMPNGHTGAILMDGLILMERPIELTREAMAEDKARAKAAVRIKEEQLGATPNNTFERNAAHVSKSFERAVIED